MERNIGQEIMEGIISGNLVHAKCAVDADHGCVCVWSSGAAEQIEALAQPSKDRENKLREALESYVALHGMSVLAKEALEARL